MKSRKPITSFAPHEIRRFILPLTLASIFFMAVIILDGVLVEPAPNIITIIYGVTWIIIILLYDFFIATPAVFRESFSWFYSITNIIGLGVLIYILPPHLGELFHVMIIFSIVGVAIVSGRAQAYIIIAGTLAVSLLNRAPYLVNVENTLEYQYLRQKWAKKVGLFG